MQNANFNGFSWQKFGSARIHVAEKPAGGALLAWYGAAIGAAARRLRR
jgi:hypothetical protein